MKCIFLVEDNADNADLICDILADLFHIVHFRSAAPLLRGLRETTSPLPELLLLDISLPDMDGIELLQAIRTLPDFGSIPAIAITAHAMNDDRELLLRKGFNDYVSKPIVDEEKLLNAIYPLLPPQR
ncbi:MAG TPA: response regulator [Opitutales bacterium]|nr:response regulator [Opitutales bacterium]